MKRTIGSASAGTDTGPGTAETVGATTWRGAEATVVAGIWMGRPCIAKDRVLKAYRHPDLDGRLRHDRTRDEANLLLHARRAGVAVPVVFDVDRAGTGLRMERVNGATLREVLARDEATAARHALGLLGEAVGRLHAAGLCHGDLTTSNVLVVGPDAARSLVLIDFGLGSFAVDAEPQAVDLHLLEEALVATDGRAETLFAAFLGGYETTMPAARSVLDRLAALRDRGRYR